MIAAVVSFILVLLMYWMFQVKLRELLWHELAEIPQRPIPLVLKTIKTQLMTLSPKNIFFQAQIDLELGIKSYRECLLLLCMNRLSVFLVGSLILVSLNQVAVVVLAILGGIILFLFSKNPKTVLQVIFLFASFLVLYQFSFFSISKWIFTADEFSLLFIFTDARLPSLLLLLFLAFFFTILFKVEFAFVLFSSLLFFSGSLPITNAVALILGEILAWSCLHVYWANAQSRFGKRLYIEILLINLAAGILVLSSLLFLRSYGWLNVRIMGGFEDKKILFLGSWALLEIVLTVLLMIWGHFRYLFADHEPSDVQPLYFSKKLLRISGVLPQQTYLRLEKALNKLSNLQRSKSELTQDELKLIPKPFFKKLLIEVETLKSLIEQLKSRT